MGVGKSKRKKETKRNGDRGQESRQQTQRRRQQRHRERVNSSNLQQPKHQTGMFSAQSWLFSKFWLDKIPQPLLTAFTPDKNRKQSSLYLTSSTTLSASVTFPARLSVILKASASSNLQNKQKWGVRVPLRIRNVWRFKCKADEHGGKKAWGGGPRGGGRNLGRSSKEMHFTTKNFEVLSSS